MERTTADGILRGDQTIAARFFGRAAGAFKRFLLLPFDLAEAEKKALGVESGEGI